ncbi:hypothetical protein [Streptomyces hainanensis]|uniref:ESX-1 secretion-associated protein n=1 Tax=Streptomyces hainanensis TaxID=402648 RepID=A0A4R4TAD3_9ACTN|nr:hypothetical protein [Streptomyces hainanensis]TDC72956.1 hypothetical protein E1283_20365 [Streptomyces hainanensis]
MTETGDVDLNPGAARQAGDHARDSERLAAMRAAFDGVGGAGGLFGQVPGGELAERALESAASTMADELGWTGLTVQDISDSAYRMAEIADETDQAARGRLVAAGEAVQRLSSALGGAQVPSTSGAG